MESLITYQWQSTCVLSSSNYWRALSCHWILSQKVHVQTLQDCCQNTSHQNFCLISIFYKKWGKMLHYEDKHICGRYMYLLYRERVAGFVCWSLFYWLLIFDRFNCIAYCAFALFLCFKMSFAKNSICGHVTLACWLNIWNLPYKWIVLMPKENEVLLLTEKDMSLPEDVTMIHFHLFIHDLVYSIKGL